MTTGTPKTTEEFRLAVLGAVDEAFLVLGVTVRDSVYYHLEKKGKVRREEIPDRVEAFHEALEDLLGAGAKVVEKLIAKHLYERLSLAMHEREDWTIVEYIGEARRHYGSVIELWRRARS